MLLTKYNSVSVVKYSASSDHLLLCLHFALILLLQQLSDKNIATIVEMGFSVQQATTALQQSAGSLDVALNSLLPPEEQTVPANGPPVLTPRESRGAPAASVTSNGLAHRSDRADTTARHQPPDSSHIDRTGTYSDLHTYDTCSVLLYCELLLLLLLQYTD